MLPFGDKTRYLLTVVTLHQWDFELKLSKFSYF